MRARNIIAALLVLPAVSALAAEDAAALYNQTCVVCHGGDGKGVVPGTPDFNKSDSPLRSKDVATLVRNVMQGFQSPGSPMAMPARGGMPSLTEDQATNLVGYLRSRFGSSP